jgi:hypothetical protein
MLIPLAILAHLASAILADWIEARSGGSISVAVFARRLRNSRPRERAELSRRLVSNSPVVRSSQPSTSSLV